MVLNGETMGVGAVAVRCPDYSGDPGCGKMHQLRVCQSGAGFYLGFWCDETGPISRESGYFGSREEAEKALAEGFEHRITEQEGK